jgi:hypothetical protein
LVTPELNNHALSRPFVIAGMHRSGTSMTASWMQALGVDVGQEFLPANVNNQPGYFEDVDFVALHRAIFEAACRHDEPGNPDVGWTESESLDMASVENFRDRAQELIRARNDNAIWGWKDPRTTVLLPFWQTLLPQARYVLVYRHPWDVVDSMYRASQRLYEGRPDFPIKIWTYYNRKMLEFYLANRDVCVLVNTNVLVNHLERFGDLLGQKLGMPLREGPVEVTLKGLFNADLMKNMPDTDPVVTLFQIAHPETVALLQAMDAVADIASDFSGTARPTPAAAAAMHWKVAVASRLVNQQAQFESTATQLKRRESELAQVLNSTSWRLTQPVRSITRVIKRLTQSPRVPS